MPRNRDSVLGMDTIYVTLWRIELDFYTGDEEGLSGSREQRGQRHRGKKFHGTLSNTAVVVSPLVTCPFIIPSVWLQPGHGWGRGRHKVTDEAKKLGRNWTLGALHAVPTARAFFCEHWCLRGRVVR